MNKNLLIKFIHFQAQEYRKTDNFPSDYYIFLLGLKKSTGISHFYYMTFNLINNLNLEDTQCWKMLGIDVAHQSMLHSGGDTRS